MAHKIETDEATGRAAFASARESAWHGLGTTVDTAMSAEEALRLAHLTGWNVRKTALTTNVMVTVKGKEQQIEVRVPDHFAIVRDNPFKAGTVDQLGVVGSKYHPIQNEEHAALLNALHDESGAFFETAGSLRGGRETFLTMRLPDTMLVGGKDAVDTYIAAINSHDGSKSFRFIVTPIRIVCANTLAMAERNTGAAFKVRHTKNSTTAITAAVRDALGITYSFVDAFEVEAERMIQETLTTMQFEQIVGNLFPIADNATDLIRTRTEAHRAGVLSLFDGESETMKGIEGTNWAGFQAVTEYLDHYIPFAGMAGQAAQARRNMLAVRGKSNVIKAHAFGALKVAA